MMPGNGASCIQFNEGQGSGTTPYWSFYTSSHGFTEAATGGKTRINRPYSLIDGLKLQG